MKNTADQKCFRCALRAAIFLIAAFLPAVAGAASVEFLRVIDGDSLVAADGERLRLLCVDAPEHDQPGGAAARARLRALTRGGVEVRRLGIDDYGRALVLLEKTALRSICHWRAKAAFGCIANTLAPVAGFLCRIFAAPKRKPAPRRAVCGAIRIRFHRVIGVAIIARRAACFFRLARSDGARRVLCFLSSAENALAVAHDFAPFFTPPSALEYARARRRKGGACERRAQFRRDLIS